MAEQRINAFQLTEHFNLREFQCRCCGTVKLDFVLVQKLEELRRYLGVPVRVTSGYRCPAHNQAVGGVKDSLHCQGLAADIVVPDRSLAVVRQTAAALGFGGIGDYGSFLHLDLGAAGRRWRGNG